MPAVSLVVVGGHELASTVVPALALGAAVVSMVMLVMLGSCCGGKEEKKGGGDGGKAAKTKTLPKKNGGDKPAETTTLPKTKRSDDPSSEGGFGADASASPFGGGGIQRQNPLFRNSIGSNPRNSDAGLGGRKLSTESSFSGFGDDSGNDSKPSSKPSSKPASASNLNAADQAAGYIGIAESDDAGSPDTKPKPARDLGGAKAKKDADRAAKIAKMKAARAAKKGDEASMLADALAIIDNLSDE